VTSMGGTRPFFLFFSFFSAVMLFGNFQSRPENGKKTSGENVFTITFFRSRGPRRRGLDICGRSTFYYSNLRVDAPVAWRAHALRFFPCVCGCSRQKEFLTGIIALANWEHWNENRDTSSSSSCAHAQSGCRSFIFLCSLVERERERDRDKVTDKPKKNKSEAAV
jgi:hypothetical protein